MALWPSLRGPTATDIVPTARLWHMFSQKTSVGLLALCCLGVSACGSTATSTATSAPATTGAATTMPPATTVPATSAAPTTTAGAAPRELRDVRYCEILLLTKPADHLVGNVWTTSSRNFCPDEQWKAIDLTKVKTDKGALAAIANGPRHWTLDHIVTDIVKTAPVDTFGSLEMINAATIDFGTTLPSTNPYAERTVNRKTLFQFSAGAPVFELTSPEGKKYVMQSYSLMIDPTQTIDTLAGLATKLKLPAGWSFASRTLTSNLDVTDVDGKATVIQDDLANTYQFENTAP